MHTAEVAVVFHLHPSLCADTHTWRRPDGFHTPDPASPTASPFISTQESRSDDRPLPPPSLLCRHSRSLLLHRRNILNRTLRLHLLWLRAPELKNSSAAYVRQTCSRFPSPMPVSAMPVLLLLSALSFRILSISFSPCAHSFPNPHSFAAQWQMAAAVDGPKKKSKIPEAAVSPLFDPCGIPRNIVRSVHSQAKAKAKARITRCIPPYSSPPVTPFIRPSRRKEEGRKKEMIDDR